MQSVFDFVNLNGPYNDARAVMMFGLFICLALAGYWLIGHVLGIKGCENSGGGDDD